VHRGNVYVLEVNPRASRTVPFLSKVTGVPMVKLATRVMLGEKLLELGWATGLVPPRDLVAVKAPVFSMNKLPAVDSYLGPEMKSTGEAIGIDRTLTEALRKAFAASGVQVPRGGSVLLTIANVDKPEMFPPGRGRLVRRPETTGSPIDAITMGMAVVARFAAPIPAVAWVTITSTLRRIRSATSSGSRSYWPSAHR